MEKFSLDRVDLLKKEKNYRDLFLYCQQHAQYRDKRAILELASCYRHGWGTDKNELHARMLHQALVDMGDVDGYEQLAWDYHEGIGVKKNDKKAFQYFFQAAAKGAMDAKFNLGIFYHNGLGIEKDDHKAKHWFEQAAVLGHARAQFNLGICYRNGIGCKPDLIKAQYWLEQACNQGYSLAFAYLGRDNYNYVLKELDEIKDQIQQVSQYVDEPMDLDRTIDSLQRQLERLRRKSHGNC